MRHRFLNQPTGTNNPAERRCSLTQSTLPVLGDYALQYPALTVCWTNLSPLVMQSLKMVLISCQRLGNLERGLEESLKNLLPFLLYEANLLSSLSGCPFLCHPGPISALLLTSMPWIYLWFLSTFNLTSLPLEKPESSCLPWEIGTHELQGSAWKPSSAWTLSQTPVSFSLCTSSASWLVLYLLQPFSLPDY